MSSASIANRSDTGATAILTAHSASSPADQAAVTLRIQQRRRELYHRRIRHWFVPPLVSFTLTTFGPVFAGLVVNSTDDSFAPGAGDLAEPARPSLFANTAQSGNSSITAAKSIQDAADDSP